VRVGERETHRQVVDLLHRAGLALGLHPVRRLGAADRLVEHLVPPPVEDVVSGQRVAVAPSHAPAEGDRPRTLVGRAVNGLGKMRLDRVAVRRPPDQRRVAQPPGDHPHVVGAGRQPHPRPAVRPHAVNGSEDHRFGPDAFGHRGQVTVVDQCLEHRRLAPGPPRGVRALRVVHPLVQHERVVGIEADVAHLNGGFDRRRVVLWRAGVQVGSEHQPQPPHAERRTDPREHHAQHELQGPIHQRVPPTRLTATHADVSRPAPAIRTAPILVQVGRALLSGARGQPRGPHRAPLPVAPRASCTRLHCGNGRGMPIQCPSVAGVTQLVECQPSKLNVAGSTPVARFLQPI
jgi:hypothetical protein